jgi:thymidylate synthase
MSGHFGWIGEEHCLTVRFEELLTDPNEIKKIGEYLGKPLRKNHFELLWGDTLTFTNDLTEWRDFWTDEVNTAWIEKGGVEIENKMCYFNTIAELPKRISVNF